MQTDVLDVLLRKRTNGNYHVADARGIARITGEGKKVKRVSDLISRQDAINEVVAWLKDRMSDKKNGKPLTDRINDLPSAQPKQSIAEWQKDFREYINMLNIPRDDYNGIMEYINDLPSAEPKIIHCKDCRNRGEDECPMRHVERIEWEEDGYIEVDDIVHDYTKPYGYCDKGERNE